VESACFFREFEKDGTRKTITGQCNSNEKVRFHKKTCHLSLFRYLVPDHFPKLESTVPYRTVRTEDSDVTGLKILAETNFQNREWDSDEEKSEQIRNEERTPTVLNRESRKSPDIAKADCRTRGREVKGCPRTPKFTCLGLVLAVGFGGSR